MSKKIKLRVVVLGNNDMTSDIVFSNLLTTDEVEILYIADTASLFASKEKKRTLQALKLLTRMDYRYWTYLAYTNAMFAMRSLITKFLSKLKINSNSISLRDLAAAQKLEYEKIDDFNSKSFKQKLRALKPDLVVIRINQILDDDFLSIPRYGTWCLHSSILPSYGGYTAEFHSLRNNEEKLGSTLFNVDATIDCGCPLFQTAFPSTLKRSLFNHMIQNNLMAAELITSSVFDFSCSRTIERKIVRPVPNESYFRWPLKRDIDQFKVHGRSLMDFNEIFILAIACFLPFGKRADFKKYMMCKMKISWQTTLPYNKT